MFFLLSFLILLTSCSNDPKEVKTFVSNENPPSETMNKAELIYTEAGKIRLKIIAEKIASIKDKCVQEIANSTYETAHKLFTKLHN